MNRKVVGWIAVCIWLGIVPGVGAAQTMSQQKQSDCYTRPSPRTFIITDDVAPLQITRACAGVNPYTYHKQDFRLEPSLDVKNVGEKVVTAYETTWVLKNVFDDTLVTIRFTETRKLLPGKSRGSDYPPSLDTVYTVNGVVDGWWREITYIVSVSRVKFEDGSVWSAPTESTK